MNLLVRLLPAAFALTAAAQSPLPPAVPATPPTLDYRSALDGYRPFTDEPAVPWTQANDAVRRRGGWRAYAAEAAAADASDGTAPPSAANPHAGHTMPMPMPIPQRAAP